MVVGMIVTDAVFKTKNVIILLVAVSFSLFSFCISLIVFSPNGVAAFPKPSIFIMMLLPIYVKQGLLFGISGKIIFKIGDGVHNWRDLAVIGQSVAPHKHSPYKTLNPTYEVL